MFTIVTILVEHVYTHEQIVILQVFGYKQKYWTNYNFDLIMVLGKEV